jgi:hypothetical protein
VRRLASRPQQVVTGAARARASAVRRATRVAVARLPSFALRAHSGTPFRIHSAIAADFWWPAFKASYAWSMQQWAASSAVVSTGQHASGDGQREYEDE